MRIGIITFHRAHNYGAVLQCYALQEVLKSMGHTVEIIDYRQEWTESVYKVFSIRVLFVRYPKLREKIQYIWRIRTRFRPFMLAKRNYSAFREKFLCISDKYHPSDELNYDVCIVGSDQLWGINCLGNKPDSVYLGDFRVRAGCKRIAYAISSNLMSIDYLHQNSYLKKSLDNFDAASFREHSVIDRIYQYTQCSYIQCVDPTLLTTDSIWLPMLNNKWKFRNYIVCYRARGNGNSGFSVEQIADSLADNLGCEVVDLTSNVLPVEDFVSAIANAKYVITTSFHATVFALIFRVPLASYLLHDGHDARYEDLLKRIGGNQLIYEVSQYPKLDVPIDWEGLHLELSNYISESISFLFESIG